MCKDNVVLVRNEMNVHSIYVYGININSINTQYLLVADKPNKVANITLELSLYIVDSLLITKLLFSFFFIGHKDSVGLSVCIVHIFQLDGGFTS
jgi:hypothetical protein